MAGRPWVLTEAVWPEVLEAGYKVAVLPWGATEAHNRHLPYGTDVIETEALAQESARRAWDAGAHVVVLPCVPFGVNTQQLDIPGTVNMRPSTQARVLADVIESVEAWSVPKLLILNGHGGNDFRQMIREAQVGTGLFLCVVDWFRIPGTDHVFEEPGDHAGEAETSLMLHRAPHLVRPLDEAGAGGARSWALGAMREGWAWAPRRWTEVTEDTGVGDPRAATAEKGAEFFEAVTGRIADFLLELASADPERLYE